MSLRNRERFTYILIGLAVIGVILIGVVIYFQIIKVPYIQKAAREAALLEIEAKKGVSVDVLVTRDIIEQGTELDPSKLKLELVKVSADMLPDGAIKDRKLLEGKVAKISIPKNTVLVPSMFVEYNSVITSDLRRQDYSHIRLTYNLAKGNYVDIRIRRPDGTDDIVISKKEILDISGTTICVNINEPERQLLNAASVEAKVRGAELYTTLYIDAQNQPSATVTYKVDEKIMALIRKNPNVINEALEALEGAGTRRSMVSDDTLSNYVNMAPEDESSTIIATPAPTPRPEGGTGTTGSAVPTNDSRKLSQWVDINNTIPKQ